MSRASPPDPDPSCTALKCSLWAGKAASDDGKQDAFNLLDRFGFPRARCYEKVGSLSGGERRRLQLLGVLVKRPNVLLLDEPSNDLDITTLGALESYLRDEYEVGLN